MPESKKRRRKSSSGDAASAKRAATASESGDAPRNWKETGQRFKKGAFTKAELELLVDAANEYVKAHSAGDELHDMAKCTQRLLFSAKRSTAWLEISSALPNRTVQACYYAAKRRLYPAKKGKWDSSEVDTLKSMVASLGTASGKGSWVKVPWKTIGEELDRLPEACRDKWRDMAVADKQTMGRWSSVRPPTTTPQRTRTRAGPHPRPTVRRPVFAHCSRGVTEMSAMARPQVEASRLKGIVEKYSTGSGEFPWQV